MESNFQNLYIDTKNAKAKICPLDMDVKGLQ